MLPLFSSENISPATEMRMAHQTSGPLHLETKYPLSKSFSVFVHFPIWYYSKTFYSFLTTHAFQCLSSLFCLRQFLFRNPSCLYGSFELHKNSQEIFNMDSTRYSFPTLSYTFPQLRLPLISLPSPLIISLLYHSWSLFFMSWQAKRLSQKFMMSFCFCPYHGTRALLSFHSKHPPPKCLNVSTRVISGAFRHIFFKPELLLQPNHYFIPYMKLISVATPLHNVQGATDNVLFWGKYDEILGVWFDPTRQPVLATLKTCLTKQTNSLYDELYWAKRITIKYQRKLSHKYFCPIPELLGYATFDVKILSNDPTGEYQQALKCVCLIQHQVIGPTFSEVIKAERNRKDWLNDVALTKSRIHLKLVLCYKALHNVWQLGMLAVRHNNLSPSSFKIDSCASKNFMKCDVKLIALSQATTLLSTNVSEHLFLTNPWFRSPELTRVLARKTNDKETSSLCIPIGRTSDAWSAGLSLACFLLAKDLAVDCSDIGPLCFDPIHNRWEVDPTIWVQKVRDRLISPDLDQYTPKQLWVTATTILDHLVIPNRYERSIPKMLTELKQLIS